MQSEEQTNATLRGLVQDLDDKLASRSAVPHIDDLASLHASGSLNGLVSDLDAKLTPKSELPAGEHAESLKATTRHYTRGVPVWVASLAVAALLLGLGTAVVRPWNQGCDLADNLCQIAGLDVDLMQSRIPNSDLASALPQLEVLDPDNVFTFGDVFAMESFAEINFEELLSDADIERLLGPIG